MNYFHITLTILADSNELKKCSKHFSKVVLEYDGLVTYKITYGEKCKYISDYRKSLTDNSLIYYFTSYRDMSDFIKYLVKNYKIKYLMYSSSNFDDYVKELVYTDNKFIKKLYYKKGQLKSIGSSVRDVFELLYEKAIEYEPLYEIFKNTDKINKLNHVYGLPPVIDKKVTVKRL